MEVRPKGVAVTVAYPPDTDTPQLQWEVRSVGAAERDWTMLMSRFFFMHKGL